jgi:uncharacterized protein (TIGR02271 family)
MIDPRRYRFMTTGNYPSGGTWEIDTGWDVVTSDGEKLGDVDEVHPHYLVVSKGWLFPTERYVPVSTITDVTDNTVYINVSKAEVDAQGWDTIPDVAGTTDSTSYRDTEDMVDTTRFTGQTDMTRTTSGTDDISVPVVEEQLRVDTREVERGAVHVHKEVVETEQQVTVPVREERVRIERHPGAGSDVAAVSAHVFEEEDIEIPLRSEEVEVTKRPVVREHVHISKDVVEHEEQATGTVRREEVVVEGDDAIDRTSRS